MERRGKIWFTLQFPLFCGILLAPFFTHAQFPVWLRTVGAITLVGGVFIALRGYQTLGSSHSPWTSPLETGTFVSTGIYSYLRHPIYTGWILGTLGLQLLAQSRVGIGVAAALFFFYDLKSREEEKWLIAKYPEYPTYMRKVSRFLPFLY